MMMPVPMEGRPSHCLRLSQPRIYSNIVDSMKKTKGCRDWRNFAVFYDNDVDELMDADDYALKRKEGLRAENAQIKQSQQHVVSRIALSGHDLLNRIEESGWRKWNRSWFACDPGGTPLRDRGASRPYDWKDLDTPPFCSGAVHAPSHNLQTPRPPKYFCVAHSVASQLSS